MKALFGALALLVATTAATPMCGTVQAQSCCKMCGAGKACGNSCIARDKICKAGPGCACNK